MPGNPFHWNAAATAHGSVSNVNAAIALLSPSKGPSQVRVVYVGTGVCFIRRGIDNTVVADATADMPLVAGAIEVLTLDNMLGSSGVATTYIGAITSGADAGTLYVTTGDGT